MNRKERRRAKAKSRNIEIRTNDIPNMVDAVFRGSSDGWVVMAANAKGRRCIEQVFPDAIIAWRDNGDDGPKDWLSFEMNVPDAASVMRHNLPPIYDTPLDEAKPDAIAFVLAIAAKDQGARTLLMKEDGTGDIFLGAEQ